MCSCAIPPVQPLYEEKLVVLVAVDFPRELCLSEFLGNFWLATVRTIFNEEKWLGTCTLPPLAKPSLMLPSITPLKLPLLSLSPYITCDRITPLCYLLLHYFLLHCLPLCYLPLLYTWLGKHLLKWCTLKIGNSCWVLGNLFLIVRYIGGFLLHPPSWYIHPHLVQL